MAKRSLTLTVYKIEAQLIDVTRAGSAPGSEYLHGWITVYAHGYGYDQSWKVPGPDHYHIGDQVTIIVDEDS